MNENLHVAWCPYCNQGWVDIEKDSGNGTLLLVCEECDTTWEKPTDIELDNPIHYEFTGNLKTPSINEIKEIGWDKLLIP